MRPSPEHVKGKTQGVLRRGPVAAHRPGHRNKTAIPMSLPCVAPPVAMLLVALASLLSLFGCRRAARRNDPESRAPQKLQRLCIFYGWPSAFDGARSPDEAAAKLGRYQVVVVGGGLEQAEHGDHAATRQIIDQLREAGTEVYGYVALGATTGYTTSQIKKRIKAGAGAVLAIMPGKMSATLLACCRRRPPPASHEKEPQPWVAI